VLRLARLAVDSTAQNRGLGRTLLRYVFLLALKTAEDFGCVGVVVDAKPGSVEFYTRFGFSPLEVAEGQMASRPEPNPMFLPRDLIEAALAPRAP
jgi:predicted N-acetyltransferase YhbS